MKFSGQCISWPTNLSSTTPGSSRYGPAWGTSPLNAGVYLLAKLGMNVIAEYEASGLFDVDHVEVKEGIIQPLRRPRNRFFVWTDPSKKHDLIVFVGEANRLSASMPFCQQLISYARDSGARTRPDVRGDGQPDASRASVPRVWGGD